MAPQKQAAAPDFIPDAPATPAGPAFIPDAPAASQASLADANEAEAKSLPSGMANHPLLGAIHDFIKGKQQSFDTETQTNPQEPLLQTGLKRVVGALGSPIVHPLDTALAVGHMGDIGPSNPGQQRGAEAVEDYQQGGLPYAATKAGGDILGGYLGGKVLGAAGEAARAVPERFGNPSPNYVPQVEQNIRSTVKALNLPTGAVEPLVKDLMGPNGDGSVAGIINHYAAKGGKPIVGPLDAAKLT